MFKAMSRGLLVFLVVMSSAVLAAGSSATGYGGSPLAQDFIDRMVSEHGFDRQYLERIFAQAEKKQSIIDAMNRPAEKVKVWKDYRQIFIQEKRIDLGAEFWRQHQQELDRAYEKYGVDPAIIVAIIGVETYYGRNKGSYRVIDALSTLAFDYPKRSQFFTSELENFLLLAREQKQDPLALMGSYAGAMGYGQFMPSSYRAYAVDFSGDGFTDIWDSSEDAIGSVANYFVRHGWKAGQPVATEATAKQGFNHEHLNKLRKPDQSPAQLKQAGLTANSPVAADLKAMPLYFEGEKGDEYWLGFTNFYVITRYNHSHRYAMAVYQLSELIRERVGATAR